ncbi:MAG: hypothetical protein KBT36_12920 [Kurthia sp.]|nr:hypothetical protein [Candidatus Kurthia equi]
MTDYIMMVIVALGIILLGVGLLNLMMNGNRTKVVISTFLGLFLFIAAVGYFIYTQQQDNEALIQNIAEMLNTETSDIIVEDISESSLFSKSKNVNLRKVYFEKKTYLVEVKDYKVLKIVEQP